MDHVYSIAVDKILLCLNLVCCPAFMHTHNNKSSTCNFWNYCVLWVILSGTLCQCWANTFTYQNDCKITKWESFCQSMPNKYTFDQQVTEIWYVCLCKMCQLKRKSTCSESSIKSWQLYVQTLLRWNSLLLCGTIYRDHMLKLHKQAGCIWTTTLGERNWWRTVQQHSVFCDQVIILYISAKSNTYVVSYKVCHQVYNTKKMSTSE